MAEIVTRNSRGHITNTDRTDDASAKAIVERHVAELGWYWILDDGTQLLIQKGGQSMTATLSKGYTL